MEARNFDREETIQYFEREVLMATGTGGRGLVAESFFRSLGKTLHEIEDEDIQICIQTDLNERYKTTWCTMPLVRPCKVK
jgi:hypothetical protein